MTAHGLLKDWSSKSNRRAFLNLSDTKQLKARRFFWGIITVSLEFLLLLLLLCAYWLSPSVSDSSLGRMDLSSDPAHLFIMLYVMKS